MVALLGGIRRRPPTRRTRGRMVSPRAHERGALDLRPGVGRQLLESRRRHRSGCQRRIAEPLTSHISYGSEIVRIEHGAAGVRAIALVRGERQSFDAEHSCLCDPVLGIATHRAGSGVSPGKRQLVDNAARTSRPCRSSCCIGARPWERSGLNGFARHGHGRGNLSPDLLQGRSSRASWSPTRKATWPEASRLSLTRREHGPPSTPSTSSFRVRDSTWGPLSSRAGRGTLGGRRSGEIRRHPPRTIPAMRAPEGRIHFAGEHLSERSQGWMEGAIESGYYAADEVDRS